MRNDAGVTFIELLIVMAVGLTLTASAVLPFQATAAVVQADANLRIVEGQLKFAREAAVNQRRGFEVRFVLPNLIEVVRHELPEGTTVVSSARLDHGMQFAIVGSAPDTPDGFGRDAAIDFGGALTTEFSADGMFTDAAGNPVNGSVYLGRPGAPETARALTIFGMTARVRSYRWNGSLWRQ